MRAEAAVAGARGGIDERRGPRRRGAVAEVGAFGVEGGDVAGRGQEQVVDGAGGQAGAVDECFGGDGIRAAGAVGGVDFVARGEAVDARDGGVEGRFAAEGLEAAFEVGHQCVRVYDARCEGFEHAGFGADVGFALVGFLERDEARGDGDGAGEGVNVG